MGKLTDREHHERPARCRNRLRDEGKPYPRNGCAACNYALKSGIVLGCPHEPTRADLQQPESER